MIRVREDVAADGGPVIVLAIDVDQIGEPIATDDGAPPCREVRLGHAAALVLASTLARTLGHIAVRAWRAMGTEESER